LQSSITNDMTSAQLRVPSLTVRLYSSEQGKSETLRLDMRIMSNEIFCSSSVARAIRRHGRCDSQMHVPLLLCNWRHRHREFSNSVKLLLHRIKQTNKIDMDEKRDQIRRRQNRKSKTITKGDCRRNCRSIIGKIKGKNFTSLVLK